MIKRNSRKSRPEGVEPGVGGAVWIAVGHRLRRKRIEFGFSADRVAQQTGIPVESYEAYENGAAIPAALLAEIAGLLEAPLVWFFQGVGDNEPGTEEPDEEAPEAEPIVYRVATVEHRIQALAESFRKLDFEGQQHLLALSEALSRPNSGAGRD